MATARKTSAETKATPAQLRKRNEQLEERVKLLEENSSHCDMCDKTKKKEMFYVCSDPLMKSGVTRICKACAKDIACRKDKNGELHSPTKDSLILALRYLDKPFLETVYNASIQESENLITGKVKTNFAMAYFKNIQMVNYLGMTYADSDFFKEKIVYEDEKTVEQIVEDHAGQDTYDDYLKNKGDVVRLLSYDPFEQEAVSDQPFLYSQLLGLLDSSEDANDDMMRTASAISIVRGFLQQSKLDDAIAKLMIDIQNIEKNAASIRSLQDSKSKMTTVISKLAEDSCISLKHNKNAKKGENTWTGKIKKIKDLSLREGEVNGFDIATCKAMKQVMDLSNASILQQLHLDESEWSDMISEQRQMVVKLQDDLDKYIEISRILLRENIDIKDTLQEKNIDLGMNYVNLNDLYSCFSVTEHEDEESEHSSNVESDGDKHDI